MGQIAGAGPGRDRRAADFAGAYWWVGKAAGEGKPFTAYPLADLDHVFKRMRSGESAEEIFASEE